MLKKFLYDSYFHKFLVILYVSIIFLLLYLEPEIIFGYTIIYLLDYFYGVAYILSQSKIPYYEHIMTYLIILLLDLFSSYFLYIVSNAGMKILVLKSWC